MAMSIWLRSKKVSTSIISQPLRIDILGAGYRCPVKCPDVILSVRAKIFETRGNSPKYLKGKYKKMNGREQLVDLVKAAGQEIVDRAEDFVGNSMGDITNFSILVRIESLNDPPTVEVQREHIVQNSYEVIHGYRGK